MSYAPFFGSGDCPDSPDPETRLLGFTELLVKPGRKAQSPSVLWRRWRLRFLAGRKQQTPVACLGRVSKLAYRTVAATGEES
jgi:hypothetical protein